MISAFVKRDKIILQILRKGSVSTQELWADFGNIKAVTGFVNRNKDYFFMEEDCIFLNINKAPKWIHYVVYIQEEYRKGNEWVRDTEISKAFGTKLGESLSKKKMFVEKRKLKGAIIWELSEILKQDTKPIKPSQLENELSYS